MNDNIIYVLYIIKIVIKISKFIIFYFKLGISLNIVFFYNAKFILNLNFLASLVKYFNNLVRVRFGFGSIRAHNIAKSKQLSFKYILILSTLIVFNKNNYYYYHLQTLFKIIIKYMFYYMKTIIIIVQFVSVLIYFMNV